MTIPIFLAIVLLVSVIVSILVAGLIVRLPFYDAIGPFSAGLLGLTICFVLAYAGFYLLDPDKPSEFDPQVPLHIRTLPITGLSAIIWLPIFSIVFNRLRKVRAA